MLAKLQALTTIGLQGQLIDIEVDLHRGMPNFTVVGLGDAAVQEARERVRSAVKNSGFEFPLQKITVSLAPADLKKTGPVFDLPIALGLLMASHQLPAEVMEKLTNAVVVGELALDGALRPINGILPMALACEQLKIAQLFVPAENAAEASLAHGVEVIPVTSMAQIVRHLLQKKIIDPMPAQEFPDEQVIDTTNFATIRGQEQARRALEIAAAGGHNVLMCGSPGAGKTLMANALRSILPKLTKAEALEVAQIYSIAGMLDHGQPLTAQRPFRPVHHTASATAIVGGGTRPKPGEISLAHKGVLFLDELPEFPTQVLEVMRQPLEDRRIVISRAQGSLEFPADFTLIAAMNPCPCGYYGVSDTDKQCTCNPTQVQRYQKKISGPLLDRIDLHVDISPVKFNTLSEAPSGESSQTIAIRVQQARDIQLSRFHNTPKVTNSEMNVDEIEQHCVIDDNAKGLLQQAMQQFGLSARGYHRVLKVARTIADLNQSEPILTNHVAEALQYRQRNDQ